MIEITFGELFIKILVNKTVQSIFTKMCYLYILRYYKEPDKASGAVLQKKCSRITG